MNIIEKQIITAFEQAMHEAIKTSLNGYNSPLTKYTNEVVQEHQDELKKIMREALGQVVMSKDVKESLKEAFLHKVARTLVDGLDGSVKQAADKLRQDPTIKAQMVLPIQNIIDGK